MRRIPLAFARETAEQRDIYLVNADGSGQHEIMMDSLDTEECQSWQPILE